MKIQTLLELIEPQVKNYNMRGRRFDPETSAANVSGWSLTADEKKQGIVGSGSYSAVKKDRDPHFVQKTSRRVETSKLDGYWYFIKQVIDKRLWENPYFPRVYQFKKFYQGDNAHYRVKLENLVNMEDLSREELIASVTRMVGDDPEDLGIIQPYFKKHDIKVLIENIFKRIWDGKESKEMDPSLVSAMRTIKKMHLDAKYGYDLHKGNVMFRRGPHGLHPVIVDPLTKVEEKKPRY